jgi:6,7-dimethyl-8-ribityllumazine synthase
VRPETGAPPPLPSGAGFRVAIIASRFNEQITSALLDSARATLVEAGTASGDIEEFAVPGAFEIPQAARCAAETGRYDAVVCVGCVIRGETPHFEYIAASVAQGLMAAAGETGVPMAFGVLTTDSEEQARARAGPDPGNKGREAAAAALEMAALFRRLGRPPARGSAPPFGFAAGAGDA